MKGKKIVPGLAAGFITAIACWVMSLPQVLGLEVPAPVVAAMTGLLAIIISVATPDDLEADE